MNFGILFANKVVKRTNITKDTMCKPGVANEDREILHFNLNLQKYLNYSSRLMLVPLFYYLFKKRFFDKPSPFFIREVILAGGCIVGLSLSDFASNEYMWRNSLEIVKKFGGSGNEEFYMDDNAYKTMKQKYQEKKNKQIALNTSNITKSSDKLYDE